MWEHVRRLAHRICMSFRSVVRGLGIGVGLREFICALLVAGWVENASAAAVTNTPATDTFISVHWLGPNGGGIDMVIGTQGVSADEAQNRGLMKFDFSNIPAGAQINSVTLDITVTKIPLSPATGTFELHRMLRAWSEADSTWQNRVAGEQWGEPGGEVGVDYVAAVSGTATVGSVAGQTYTFASSPGMIADVTRWITNGAENHGWLVKTEPEENAFTARRFGSSEGSSPPRLIVNYTAVAPRPVINSAALNGGQLCVGFNATAGKSYVLERRAAVDSGGWTEVATLPPPAANGPATLCDPLGTGNGFYRIGEL